MLLCHFSPLRSYLGNIQKLKTFIATTGGWGPVALILLGSISVAIGFPRTALSIIAGMLFGVVWGLLIGHVAAMCGTCLTFYGARLCRTEWLLSHCRNRYIQALLQRQPGTVAVILIRQLPVPGIAQNIALSLTRISHRSFLLGSAVGMLPVSLLFTLIGAGIGKASALQALIPPASALLAALAGLIWFKNKRNPSGTVPK